MAKQTVNIGAVANDGTGDQLRNAFDKLNDNFDEVYGNNFVTEAMLNDDIVGAAELKVTGNGTAGQILKSDGDGTFSWINNDEGDLTAIVAGTGLDGTDLSGPIPTINIEDGGVGTTQLADDAVTADKIANAVNTLISNNTAKVTNATHTGDVTGATALTIANDAVTHDKLEDRYTEVVSVTTLTGAYSLDWSTGAIFVMSGSLTGAIEFDFTNFKAGQTIDIYNLTGAQTITFDSDATTSETFNKCGGVDYAGASTNLIQVQCVDDSANAVFNYAVSAYVSDTTPS